MAVYINDNCTNMGACVPECPNNAIYEGGEKWNYFENVDLKENIKKRNDKIIDTETLNEPLAEEIYYIVADKCTECIQTHSEPQCMAVCAMDAPSFIETPKETNEQLVAKKEWLFNPTVVNFESKNSEKKREEDITSFSNVEFPYSIEKKSNTGMKIFISIIKVLFFATIFSIYYLMKFSK